MLNLVLNDSGVTIVAVGKPAERNGCRRSVRNRDRFRSGRPTGVAWLCFWLVVAVGSVGAQRIGDAPARRVADAPFAAVKDVRFNVPVTDGLVLYLAADDIEGLADDDPVGTWADGSGRENHASQNTPANRPVYKENVIGDLPVVRFNGSSHWLVLPAAALNAVFNSAQGFSVFLVMQGARTGNETFISSINSTTHLLLFRYDSLPDFRVRVGGTDYDLNFDLNVRDGDPHIMAADWDAAGNSRRLWIDGTLRAVSAGAAQATMPLTNPVNVARDARNSRYFGGDIAEILIYDRALDATERQAVEQYLGKKWLDW